MKNYCPICSGILLRHLCSNNITWFCLRCHQEMPNFNLVKFNAIQERITQFRCSQNNKIVNFNDKTQNNTLTIEQRSTKNALSIARDLKRLEVIGFILNKIDIMLVNTLIDSKNQLKRLKTNESRKSRLVRASFLRDSEIILLYICQAILVADNTVLKNVTFNFKFSIEQSLFIDLIKTLVISFVYSIALNSERSIDCFALEVGSYFEMVIDRLNTKEMELQR